MEQLARCSDFLSLGRPEPRTLRIFGKSGSGKSFLVRELMVQASAEDKHGVGIYLDIPPGELEASTFLESVDAILSRQREASRDSPSFVLRKAAKAWNSVKRGTSAKRRAYSYRASRDLTAQIPIAGPFVKALLPESMPMGMPTGNSAGSLRFLMRWSRTRPVLLAIDNVQFLPFAVREMLDVELADAGPQLRLVLVERLDQGRPLDWTPTIPSADQMDVDMESASIEEIGDLVRSALPEVGDFEDIAAAVYRRCDGNLKSAWFQLRLIASRRDDQAIVPVSYEDLILSLSPLDQAVLRFIVFTIGGMTIATLVSLLRVTDLHARPNAVIDAVKDLASLGLLVVNGDRADRVRVEHELVARVVSEVTPEEEKLELRTQAVTALSTVLELEASSADEAVLYDRLLGIVSAVELRQSPSLLSHVVRFVQIQSDLDRHSYLASICRDSVCWDVLDILPDTTVRSLLDAIQKSALFNFGLVAAARLRQSSPLHESLASLYEAKYLVQLFQYDEATIALERVDQSKEKRSVAFNIMLNLAQDERAAEIALEVYAEVSEATCTEQDYVILRNSVHLFPPGDAGVIAQAAIDGFRTLGRRFGVATALNNRGIVELASGSGNSASDTFGLARKQLDELDSSESYQPLVNLSAIALVHEDVVKARQLLSDAREVAPRSLLQDSAMLDHNEIVIELCAGGFAGMETLGRIGAVLAAASKTRDLRFLDLVTWFAHSVDQAAAGRVSAMSPSESRIERIRTSGLVPLEVFVSVRIGTRAIEVPFVLSPHWRY